MTTDSKPPKICEHCGQVIPRMTPEDARAEAQKLMATEEYAHRNHPDHDTMVERVQLLFERAYSDESQ